MQKKTLCWDSLGPERGISKFQSCSYIHSSDKAYTVGLIIQRPNLLDKG